MEFGDFAAEGGGVEDGIVESLAAVCPVSTRSSCLTERGLTESHGMSSITDQRESTVVVIPRLSLPIREATVPDLGTGGKSLKDRSKRLSKVTGLFLEVVQDTLT